MSQIKFIHLSDLHIGANDKDNREVETKLNALGSKYNEHIFLITGDLVDNEGTKGPLSPVANKAPISGKDFLDLSVLANAVMPSDMTDAKPKYDEALINIGNYFRSAFGNGWRERVFVCPGNHDYCLYGNLFDKDFAGKFDEQFFGFNNPGFKDSKNSGYHFRTRTWSVGELKVEVVALNSNPEKGTNIPCLLQFPLTAIVNPPPLASGLIGERQRDELIHLGSTLNFDLISGLTLGVGDQAMWSWWKEMEINNPWRETIVSNHNFIRVLLLHHSPFIRRDVTSFANAITGPGKGGTDPLLEIAMGTEDTNPLLATISGKIDLVLFGHFHSFKRYLPNNDVFNKPSFVIYGACEADGFRSPNARFWEIIVDNTASPRVSVKEIKP